MFQKGVDLLDRMIAKLKPETSSKLKSAVIALYSCSTTNHVRYSGKIGLLHLDIDRHLKAHMLRVYDM